jgi:hypothetical protein
MKDEMLEGEINWKITNMPKKAELNLRMGQAVRK